MRGSDRRKKARKQSRAGEEFSDAGREWIQTAVICFLLVGIVWLVFGQTLRHEFINYDDPQYVSENARIISGLNVDGIKWAFTHVHSDNWHPLTTMSHMLDCTLYGVQPWGHHFTNVFLHALGAVLLFFALLELTGLRWASAFVAAVFAIHPLRVESVAWVAERKDILSGIFFMLILGGYARYARRTRPSPGLYGLLLVLFALGLMCKPTLVTVPFVLLLLDYWPLRRFGQSASYKSAPSTGNRLRRGSRENSNCPNPVPTKSIQYLFIEKLPFLILSAASCAGTLLAQEKTISLADQLTLADRIGNAALSYVAYIVEMIWPVGLAVAYPYRVGELNIAQVVPAFLFLLIISVVFWVWRRKYPFLLVGWLWFLGMLVPMIGIVQVGNQRRADRYTYLSQIGLYLLLVWGVMALLAKWKRGDQVLVALALLIVTGLMADSYLETSFWRTSEALWNRALVNTPDNHLAEIGLCEALIKSDGRLDEGMAHCRKALELRPDNPEANRSLGYAFASKGNWAEAVTSFRAALRIKPDDSIAHNNLSISLSQLGKNEDALAECRTALRLDQNNAEAHFNLALILLQLDQRDEALLHLQEALRLKPNYPQANELLRQFEGKK